MTSKKKCLKIVWPTRVTVITTVSNLYLSLINFDRYAESSVKFEMLLENATKMTAVEFQRIIELASGNAGAIRVLGMMTSCSECSLLFGKMEEHGWSGCDIHRL